MSFIAIQTHDGAPEHVTVENGGVGVVGGVLGLALGLFSIYCGVRTWKKGHKTLFFIGLFVPVLWFIGALMKPADHVAA